MLPDLLPLPPFHRPVSGSVDLPGSKSLTNRALLLAALCGEPAELTGALSSEDTHLMVAALRSLGFTVEAAEGDTRLRVSGGDRAFCSPEPVSLFVGLAGTAARFLTALCAAAPRGIYRVDGVPQMRRRPMKGLIDALRALGADIRCAGEEGFFPLEIHARGLRGGPVAIDARESSQLLSALLMVAPLADGDVEVSLSGGVRWPFVQMTTRLMEGFGQPPVERLAEDRFRVRAGTRYRLAGGVYPIEPDATAASYFLALPMAVGGRLLVNGLRPPGGGLQGDTAFQQVLSRLGMAIEPQAGGIRAAFPADGRGRGVDEGFGSFSDTFLTLAALSPLLEGPTRISGIAHTRKQETDRVAGMAAELRRLGQDVDETEDALRITPRPLRLDQEIHTYGDHRFAMSFGILGSRDVRGDGKPWLSIRNPACCAKTFPHFFELLARVREGS